MVEEAPLFHTKKHASSCSALLNKPLAPPAAHNPKRISKRLKKILSKSQKKELTFLGVMNCTNLFFPFPVGDLWED